MLKGDFWGNILFWFFGFKEFGGKVWVDSFNGVDIFKVVI